MMQYDGNKDVVIDLRAAHLQQDGDDVIYGRGGDDYLEGGRGSDDYIYGLGDCSDEIMDGSSDGSHDQLFFKFNLADVNLSLSLSDGGHDLLMNFGSESSIQIIYWKYGDNCQIEEFIFNDGAYDADQFLIDHGLYV